MVLGCSFLQLCSYRFGGEYLLVCVVGTIKLTVNGKFINGIRSTMRKKGYICPQAEGYETHFRKIDILELPGVVITPDQMAPVAG